MLNVHEATRLLVDEAQGEVARYRTGTLGTRKLQLKELTLAEVVAVDRLRVAAGRGELTVADAKSIASQMLFDVRYGNGNYFFVFTPNMTSIVEPNPRFRGNMLDYRDPAGKYLFREFRRVAQGPGQGYVDYVANRANNNASSAKTSFIYYYKPWQWVIGTGVYIDDIEAKADSRLATVKRSLSDSLAAVKFNRRGFLFVLDRKGALVVAPRNRDMGALTDTTAGRQLAALITARAPKTVGPVTRLTTDARLDATGTRQWRFNVSTVKSSPWILVTAVPQNELDRAANRITLFALLIDALVLVLGLLVGVLASRRIVRPVQEITRAAGDLEKDRFDPKVLDAAARRNDELGTLARSFRRMGSEIVQRERLLREQVRKLTVVIDRKRVDREVSEITDSDYFQNLVEQADELRKQP